MQQPSGDFRLIVRRGPQPNQIHEMNKDIITLGRDITNDITINDPECSRHHARLTRGGGGYTMEDLGSTNGTFVNGQRLTGARPLSPGDMIGLGETVTLAYESTAAGMGAMATAVTNAPSAPAADPYAPHPYAQQPPTYSNQPYAPPSPYAPPQPGGMQYGQPPAPIYGDPQASGPYANDYEADTGRGGMGRWLLLGCGCFIVLCVIGTVVALIIIDQTCAWEQEPLVSILDTFGFEPDSTYSACQ